MLSMTTHGDFLLDIVYEPITRGTIPSGRQASIRITDESSEPIMGQSPLACPSPVSRWFTTLSIERRQFIRYSRQ